jgi:hypothetical protein
MRNARLIVGSVLVALLVGIAGGCQGRATIPSGAHLEQDGAGGMSFTAHEPGNVYVLDKDKDQKVFEGRVNTGDQLVVKPEQDQIMLAGNPANHSMPLKSGRHYAIYFDPQH